MSFKMLTKETMLYVYYASLIFNLGNLSYVNCRSNSFFLKLSGCSIPWVTIILKTTFILLEI